MSVLPDHDEVRRTLCVHTGPPILVGGSGSSSSCTGIVPNVCQPMLTRFSVHSKRPEDQYITPIATRRLVTACKSVVQTLSPQACRGRGQEHRESRAQCKQWQACGKFAVKKASHSCTTRWSNYTTPTTLQQAWLGGTLSPSMLFLCDRLNLHLVAFLSHTRKNAPRIIASALCNNLEPCLSRAHQSRLTFSQGNPGTDPLSL